MTSSFCRLLYNSNNVFRPIASVIILEVIHGIKLLVTLDMTVSDFLYESCYVWKYLPASIVNLSNFDMFKITIKNQRLRFHSRNHAEMLKYLTLCNIDLFFFYVVLCKPDYLKHTLF